jgi:hypothetical protein
VIALHAAAGEPRGESAHLLPCAPWGRFDNPLGQRAPLTCIAVREAEHPHVDTVGKAFR